MIIFDRIIIILIVAIGIGVVGVLSFFWISSHWYTDIRPIFAGKVITDPDDPKFDPMQFRFEYYKTLYRNEWELPAVLLKMFPPGTKMEYVDKILAERNEVEKYKNQGFKFANDYTYSWSVRGMGLSGHAIHIVYDDAARSIVMYLGANRLYESEIYRNSLRPDVREYISKNEKTPEEGAQYLESKMRPIRKKYLDNETGFIK